MDKKLFLDNEMEFMKYELSFKYKETAIMYEIFESINNMDVCRIEELQKQLHNVQKELKWQLYDKECHSCKQCSFEMIDCLICGRIYKVCSTFQSYSCMDCESHVENSMRKEEFMETDDSPYSDESYDLFDSGDF